MNFSAKRIVYWAVTLLVLALTLTTALPVLAREDETPTGPAPAGEAVMTLSGTSPSSFVVIKKAQTSFNRNYYWTIDKSADVSAVTLASGTQYQVNYTVTVNATSMDGGWTVGGGITLFNQSPDAVTVNSVTDLMSPDITVPVNCDALPITLPSGWSAVCTYTAYPPDGSQRVNTATVTLADGSIYTGTADVIFGAPASEVDECINVTDSVYGFLGTVCYGVDALPRTFAYSVVIGPYDGCGAFTVDNTASFMTNDTGATGSDSWSVAVDVPCGGSCTLTPGYWQTHSKYGPAQYDDTWALVGEDTPFFGSGLTWFQALTTEPKGNAYYILAHAYIAATLNSLNGADTAAVTTQIANAAVLLNSHTPAQIDALKGGDPLRQQFISLAETLDNYNNGYIGPGHCP